jgi:hypothetical protein
MSMGLIFWILMLFWLVFWIWDRNSPLPWGPIGNSVFLFLLFLLLGWATFGAPIR